MVTDLISHQKKSFVKLDYKGRFKNLLPVGDPSHQQKKYWLRVKGWKKIPKNRQE
jgi:hypothetical protein